MILGFGILQEMDNILFVLDIIFSHVKDLTNIMLLILLPFLFTSASGEVYGPFLLFQSYIFLVMYNALLVYADLVSRHLIAVPTCPMCHSQSETLYICFSEVFLLKFCSELYDLLVYQVISLLLWVFPIFCNSGISY